MQRRNFLKTAGVSLAAANMLFNPAWSSAAENSVKVGMCDWNLRDPQGRVNQCNPDLIPLAVESHLDGLQVSVGRNPDSIPLRESSVRNQYKEMCKTHNFTIHSVAAGSILNSIPLKSEPQSAVYVIDALEAAAALGAKNILTAFFGNGDLRLFDAVGQPRNISDGPFKIWELDSRGVTRVVEVLRQIVPRAEDLGVAIGLENTLSAEQNLEIIERVGSPFVQVYYDIANSTSNGYDVPHEIRFLGAERICEIHLKDNGKDVTRFDSPNSQIDWAKISKACKEIGFDKWYCIEESGRKDKFIEDARYNVAHAKKWLAL
ncbi:MAG: sugar phosphate isomerase/epimerase family protein [Candidatus Hinthialibacter sp.]